MDADQDEGSEEQQRVAEVLSYLQNNLKTPSTDIENYINIIYPPKDGKDWPDKIVNFYLEHWGQEDHSTGASSPSSKKIKYISMDIDMTPDIHVAEEIIKRIQGESLDEAIPSGASLLRESQLEYLRQYLGDNSNIFKIFEKEVTVDNTQRSEQKQEIELIPLAKIDTDQHPSNDVNKFVEQRNLKQQANSIELLKGSETSSNKNILQYKITFGEANRVGDSTERNIVDLETDELDIQYEKGYLEEICTKINQQENIEPILVKQLINYLEKIREVRMFDYCQENDDYQNILVIGHTGTGKSTLINYLLDNRLIVTLSNTKDFTGIRAEIKLDQGENGPVIGNSDKAETSNIIGWRDEINKIIYWDFPGFSDNRDIGQRLQNIILARSFIQTQKSVNFLILAPHSIFDTDRDNANLPNFVENINSFFGETQAQRVWEQYAPYTSFILTQGVREEPEYVNVRGGALRLVKILFEPNREYYMGQAGGRLEHEQKAIFKAIHEGNLDIAVFPKIFRFFDNVGNEMIETNEGFITPDYRDEIVNTILYKGPNHDNPRVPMDVTPEFIKNFYRANGNNSVTLIKFGTVINKYIQDLIINIFKLEKETFVSALSNESNIINHKTIKSLLKQEMLFSETRERKDFLERIEKISGHYYDRIKKAVEVFDFLQNIHQIDDLNNIAGWRDLAKDYYKLMQYKEVSNDSHFKIEGFAISASYVQSRLEQYQRDYEHNPKLIMVYSYLFVVDSDIKSSGVNLRICSLKWNIIKQRIFDLSGADGKSYLGKEAKAENGANAIDTIENGKGQNGQNGQNGGDGKFGGHFYGYGRLVIQIGDGASLTINVSGGSGGKGQVGGDGSNGLDGKSGLEKIMSEKAYAEARLFLLNHMKKIRDELGNKSVQELDQIILNDDRSRTQEEMSIASLLKAKLKLDDLQLRKQGAEREITEEDTLTTEEKKVEINLIGKAIRNLFDESYKIYSPPAKKSFDKTVSAEKAFYKEIWVSVGEYANIIQNLDNKIAEFEKQTKSHTEEQYEIIKSHFIEFDRCRTNHKSKQIELEDELTKFEAVLALIEKEYNKSWRFSPSVLNRNQIHQERAEAKIILMNFKNVAAERLNILKEVQEAKTNFYNINSQKDHSARTGYNDSLLSNENARPISIKNVGLDEIVRNQEEILKNLKTSYDKEQKIQEKKKIEYDELKKVLEKNEENSIDNTEIRRSLEIWEAEFKKYDELKAKYEHFEKVVKRLKEANEQLEMKKDSQKQAKENYDEHYNKCRNNSLRDTEISQTIINLAEKINDGYNKIIKLTRESNETHEEEAKSAENLLLCSPLLRECYREKIKFFDKESKLEALFDIFFLFNEQYIEKYSISGSQGEMGGNAGTGGLAGRPGKNGKAIIKIAQCSLILCKEEQNFKALTGKSGKIGLGGKNEKKIECLYLNEKFLPFFRGIKEENLQTNIQNKKLELFSHSFTELAEIGGIAAGQTVLSYGVRSALITVLEHGTIHGANKILASLFVSLGTFSIVAGAVILPIAFFGAQLIMSSMIACLRSNIIDGPYEIGTSDQAEPGKEAEEMEDQREPVEPKVIELDEAEIMKDFHKFLTEKLALMNALNMEEADIIDIELGFSGEAPLEPEFNAEYTV